MPLPDLYPPARPKLDGVGQGIWSTIGKWKILLHTTETRGVPGYQAGQLAPHLTYWPLHRTWTQHFKFSRPSESLVGFDNDMVIQVETICYSDRNVAISVGGLWVGDLNANHLLDLANFCRWVMNHVPVSPVWPGRQAFGYGQANAPGFRFTAAQFHAFNGILGHQHAPPGNTHWDPGAFPWQKFMPLLTPEPPEDDDMTVEQFVKGLSKQPGQIDKLVDAGVIKPAPGQTLAQTKAYWRGKLIVPEDPEWFNFIVAVQTEAALGASFSGTWTTS